MVGEKEKSGWRFDQKVEFKIDPMPIGDVSGNVPDYILESFSVETLKRLSVLFTDPRIQKDFLEWKVRKNKKIKKAWRDSERMERVEIFSILTSNLYEALLYMKETKPRFTFQLLTERLYHAR